MGAVHIKIADPFGENIYEKEVAVGKSKVSELLAWLSEQKHTKTHEDKQVVAGVFEIEGSKLFVYDPHRQVFDKDALMDDTILTENPVLRYYTTPVRGLTADKVRLQDGKSLTDKNRLVTVLWNENCFPVILPVQMGVDSGGRPLAQQALFEQILSIAPGIVPLNWRSQEWRVINRRTKQNINLAEIGELKNGDLLILHLSAPTPEDVDIVILNEEVMVDKDQDDADLLKSIDIQVSNTIDVNNCKLEVVWSALDQQDTDAIVSPAVSNLNDIDKWINEAVFSAAGPNLRRACSLFGRLEPGLCILNPGFNLPAKWVIHAVGPTYKDGLKDEAALLSNTYQSALKMAAASGFRSIAFPALSTGAPFNYPAPEAVRIALVTIIEALQAKQSFELVRFVLRTEEGAQLALDTLDQIR